MKRQRRTVGAIVEIDLENSYFSYARILEDASFAIYDIYSADRISNIHDIVNRPVLFIVAVYNDVITRGKWLKVGSIPLEKELRVLPMKFVQDALHPSRFSFYNPNTGEMTPTNKENCKGLERAAVWDAHHVEDRIRDHYAGQPCIWLREDLELFP